MRLATAQRTLDNSSENSNNEGSSSNYSEQNVGDVTNNSLHSTSSGSSPLSVSHNDASNRAMREVKEIAERETRRMQSWRVIILLSILMTGAGVSTGVYLFLTNKQESDFESEVKWINKQKCTANRYCDISLTCRLLSRLPSITVFPVCQHDCRVYFVSVPIGDQCL